MESKLRFRKLTVGCAAALISSMAFLMNYLFSMLTDSIAVSIITSLEFWGFLALEIIVFVKLRKEVETSTNRRPDEKFNKLWIIVPALFIISFILFILITIINKGLETTFGMVMLSICLFLFQMIFITKSKLFNIIVGERKDCEK